ncbi:MAG TPA: membrane protein insertase YidC [Candidatus Acidoferrales bacterium]
MKELSDEKRMLLAFVLMIAILGIWSKFYKPPAVPPKPAPAMVANVAPGNTPGATQVAPIAPPAGALQANDAETIVVESPVYRVELSNRGATAHSWKLQKYFDDQNPPRPLELVNTAAAQQFDAWPLSVTLDDPQQESKANTGLYQVSPQSTSLQAPVEVTFHWSDGHLDVVKKLKFDTNYQIELDASASLDGKALPIGIGWRGGFGDIAIPKQSQIVNVFYSQNVKLNLLQYKKLGAPGRSDQRALQPGTLAFAGIEDQFFAAAFLPNGSDVNLWHWVQQRDVVQEGKPAQEPEAQIAVGSTTPGPISLRVFVGPKDLNILSQLKPPLEDLIQFGWFGIIAKPLLFALQWTHRYVPNWGWAIVVLTILINIPLFPLKVSSWRSMKKMQKVAPEVQNIQNRYKKYSMNDPRKRKMNEEVMAVYNREGINPFGSCLPMLVQFPFLLAFYRMLGGVIELRHAPWFGWIHDLSAHDPYYILPIVMTITMYLMQKMTPMATADPAQQKMMTFMPLFMGFIFINLSSGLNLYYLTSNIVGIGQQYYLVKTHPLTDRDNSKGNKR